MLKFTDENGAHELEPEKERYMYTGQVLVFAPGDKDEVPECFSGLSSRCVLVVDSWRKSEVVLQCQGGGSTITLENDCSCLYNANQYLDFQNKLIKSITSYQKAGL